MAGKPRIPRIDAEGRRAPVEIALRPFHRFAQLESAGGILLLAMAVGAMVWANSPWAATYADTWNTHLKFALGGFELSKPLVVWINDLLMAVFFFLVGLEIKREVLVGELSSPRRAALPAIAALGGMVVPAAIYAAFNWNHPSIRGWGVPMATDIAFALGILALISSRVPVGLRVFLASLAIADDLGALLVIAIFYTEHLKADFLLWAGLCVGAMITLNVMGVRRAWAYAVIGAVLWLLVLKSGVHATIAGVVGAMAIPVRARVNTGVFLQFARQTLNDFERAGEKSGPKGIVTNTDQSGLLVALEDATEKVQTPLQRLEHGILPWVAFLIVPVFALANAGVTVEGGVSGLSEALTSRIGLGVALGLMIGKPVGVFLFSFAAVKLGAGELPRGVTWRHIHAVGWLAGVGFTMALFIANLAFPSAVELDEAKLAILVGSTLAALVGLFLLRISPRTDH